jgi:hypothetical protein
MDAGWRIHDLAHGIQRDEQQRADAVIAPDSLVVLRTPRRLRGTTAIVRRRLATGWEVEIRSPAGTPMHLVVPESGLQPL